MPYFISLGFKTAEGVALYHADASKVLTASRFGGGYLYPEELEFKAALDGARYSPGNILNFVQNGSLPRVGTMIIPNKIFFRRNGQTRLQSPLKS